MYDLHLIAMTLLLLFALRVLVAVRRLRDRAFDHATSAAAHAAEAFRHANRANERATAAAGSAEDADASATLADDCGAEAAGCAMEVRELLKQLSKPGERPTDARPLDSLTIVSDAGPPTVRLSGVPMIGLSETDDASDLRW